MMPTTSTAQESPVTESNDPGPDPTLAFVKRVSDAMAHGRDLDATLETMLSATIQALGAGRGVVTVFDRDRGSQPGPAAVEVAVSDPSADIDDAGPAVTADFPLLVSSGGVERELGSVRFSWAERAYVDAPPDLAGAAADLLAAAIDRQQLAALATERSDWYERLAQTDALTGIANARTFARILELELARAARQESDVSIAIFDIDGLDDLNQSAGRKAGDDALRNVASVVAESVRLVDTVARYGGDEFVVVAPGAAGVTVAQRVLDGVAALAPIGGRKISVSAGVARFPTDATTADGLLVAAERALAAARDGGGAGLVAAEEGDGS
jgi:diguanylate cyclase (GGDEF)-like protein